MSALDRAKSDTPFWDGGPTDNFAARYTGALQVETAGTYTFYLTSDDGSALSLDGAQVIDHDGLHATTTREVTLDLAAGAHALEVLYFERGGVQTLELDWQGPDTGGARQTIEGAALGPEPDDTRRPARSVSPRTSTCRDARRGERRPRQERHALLGRWPDRQFRGALYRRAAGGDGGDLHLLSHLR